MYSNLTNAQIQEMVQNNAPVILGTLIFSIAMVILFYFFSAFGLMKIAKKNNVNHSWLAWIPGVNTYIYGKVAFTDTLKAVLFLAIGLVSSIGSTVYSYQYIQQSFQQNIMNFNYSYMSSTANPIYSILNIAYLILFFIATYKIYKRMSDKAVIMTVLSVLSCGILIPIFLFAIRNNDVKELPIK